MVSSSFAIHQPERAPKSPFSPAGEKVAARPDEGAYAARSLRKILALFVLFVALTASTAHAQRSYPMLMNLSPTASQLGQTSEHTVESRYSMFGANQVLVSGEGVNGEVITPMELDKDGKEPALTEIKLKFTVAAEAMPGVRDFRIIGPTGPSTIGQIVITRDPVIVEDPKNDTQETAQAVTVPSTLCGCVEKAEDVDFYRSVIEQPTSLTFHCLAMRLEDRIHDLQTHVDPLIAIRNVHLRGGVEFVYGLEVIQATPQFELVMDSDKSWLTPGSCAALFVQIVRLNGFTGEVQLQLDGLPEGVTATCGKILSDKATDGCIVLEAAADAKPIASNIRVTGTAVLTQDGQEPVTLTAVAQPMQEIYMPGGGRSHYPVSMHTVAVGQPSDIRDVKLSLSEITLKPGESVKVDVELLRADGFDKNVTLDVLYQHLSSIFANTLPAGVTIDAKNSQTLLTGTNSKGSLTLTAAKDATPIDRQQCCVMANVSINFVMKATYSSRPLLITVAAP